MLIAPALSPLRTWCVTRLPLARFVPLALTLSCAASAANGTPLSETALGAVLAFALVAQFRLWDDIVDRHRDRSRYPERVLTQAASVRPLALLCGGLGVTNLCALAVFVDVSAAAGLLLLSAGLGIWYACEPPRDALHAHVVLLKYPAIVLLLSQPLARPQELLLAAAAVYTAMCAFELLDDALAHGRARAALAVHLGALSAIPALASDSAAPGVVGVLLAGALALLCWRRRRRSPIGFTAYLPFVAAAIALVSIARISGGVG